jgi:outer membrane protein assembly factor BamB
MKSRVMTASALALTALAALPAGANAAATCAEKPVTGGEWRQYGGDLRGERNQRGQTAISAETAPTLSPKWAFKVGDHGGAGTFQSTPVIADGCMFVATSAGWVFVTNADTGELVWKRKLPVGAPGLLGTGAVGAPIVKDGRVIVAISQAGDGDKSGPYVVALDQRNGSILWGPTVISTTKFDFSNSSPVVFGDVLFAGFNGDETYDASHGGFTLLDVDTGEILKRTFTIPDAEYEQGAGGGSIWATPVVDPETGYAYVGSANPTGPIESARTNAILKIDLDRERETFGEIVDSMKGTPDQVSPVTPACGKIPRIPGAPAGEGALSLQAIVGCTRADYDFGASPNMVSINGRLGVAELQKSGYVHAAYVDGDKLERAWTALTGPGFFYDNLATTASDTDNHRMFVTAGPPGQMIALDTNTGRQLWVAPIGDQLHFQSVSYSNGVVYTIDSLGFVWAWDADDGRPLLHRELRADGGDSSGFAAATSVGVAVANNGLYVADGTYVIRYELGEDGSGSGVPPLPGTPDIPVGANGAIAAGLAGASTGYLTPQAAVVEGGQVTFANGDAAPHDVIARDRGVDGEPLFASKLIGIGQTADVEGVKDLEPGSYEFYCSLHGAMKGTLTVLSPGAKRALRGAARAKAPKSVYDATGRVVEK